ncbi:MAG TPA: hypothetical protein VIM25_05240 [Candidatus Limnocylindrales bacterium]
MADISPARGRWAFRPTPPEPRSIVELIRAGTLDAELAAQLWMLIEARVPLIVAAEAQGTGKSTLLGALLDFLPPGVHLVELAGEAETFAWLPQASELGWPGRPRRTPGAEPVRPETTIILANELSDHLPAYTWGLAARVAVRAASIGYGLAATIHADSLDEVFELLRRPPVRLADDELSHLGVVLVLRRVERWSSPGRGGALRPAHRTGPARSPPAARARGPRHLGSGHGRLRALRVGRHAGAGAARRAPGRRFRDRSGPPPRPSRGARPSRRDRSGGGARRHPGLSPGTRV